MAGALYPAKLSVPDEIRDIASMVAALSRRLDDVTRRLPAEMQERMDFAEHISPAVAQRLRAAADELEAGA